MGDVQERCWLSPNERDTLTTTREGRIAISAVDGLLREHRFVEDVLAEANRGIVNQRAKLAQWRPVIEAALSEVNGVDGYPVGRCLFCSLYTMVPKWDERYQAEHDDDCPLRGVEL